MSQAAPSAIILGAGRGRRLMPLTDGAPKCYVEVGGRRILDWILDALRGAGIEHVVFVGGYQIERVQADYPELDFRHNPNWESTNILSSLFCAADVMHGPFVSSYADILYRPEIVKSLTSSSHDITLGVDTAWAHRYADRTQHPPDDAEKVTAQGDRLTRVHRAIPNAAAAGEFIGVAGFSLDGAAALLAAHQRVSAGTLELETGLDSAYLIHLVDAMIQSGSAVHMAETAGDYMEIDTPEDLQLAAAQWQ